MSTGNGLLTFLNNDYAQISGQFGRVKSDSLGIVDFALGLVNPA